MCLRTDTRCDGEGTAIKILAKGELNRQWLRRNAEGSPAACYVSIMLESGVYIYVYIYIPHPAYSGRQRSRPQRVKRGVVRVAEKLCCRRHQWCCTVVGALLLVVMTTRLTTLSAVMFTAEARYTHCYFTDPFI